MPLHGIQAKEAEMEPKRKEIRLKRGGETFIFRWNIGDENALLDAITGLADSHRTNFDIHDAAFLCDLLAPLLLRQADITSQMLLASVEG